MTRTNPHSLRYSIIAAHHHSRSYRTLREVVIHYVPSTTPSQAEFAETLCGKDSWVITRVILDSEHLCSTCIRVAATIKPPLGFTIVEPIDH